MIKKEKIKNSFLITDLLSEDSLMSVNKIFNTSYRKSQRIQKVKIKENLTFIKIKKLMEEIPGGRLY